MAEHNLEEETKWGPLLHKIASGKPSPHESKFPAPGANHMPGVLGRSLSLSDYAVPDEHQLRFIDVITKNTRK